MKKAFSFVELIIVVAILGILAAIVLPEFQSHTTQAKEAAAKDDLRVLRGAIELYAVRHNGVAPGYPDNDPTGQPGFGFFFIQTVKDEHYISTLPENPFNNLLTMNTIGNDVPFPAEPTGEFGWIYKPQTKTIKLDWPGTDSEGVSYYDY